CRLHQHCLPTASCPLSLHDALPISEVEVRPTKGQIDDLAAEIREREAKGERVLVTTLTKRMAEDLTDYLQQIGIRVRYMHSDIEDRKSTRLNSSHVKISYAVFCLKK